MILLLGPFYPLVYLPGNRVYSSSFQILHNFFCLTAVSLLLFLTQLRHIIYFNYVGSQSVIGPVREEKWLWTLEPDPQEVCLQLKNDCTGSTVRRPLIKSDSHSYLRLLKRLGSVVIAFIKMISGLRTSAEDKLSMTPDSFPCSRLRNLVPRYDSKPTANRTIHRLRDMLQLPT